MDKSAEAFRTISEAAEELHVPQHVLRFWETRFAQIKPMKRAGGRRYYRPEDMALLHTIRHLLYGEGYTIRGVQRLLKERGIKAVLSMPQTRAPARRLQDDGTPIISIDGDERTQAVMARPARDASLHQEPVFDIVPEADEPIYDEIMHDEPMHDVVDDRDDAFAISDGADAEDVFAPFGARTPDGREADLRAYQEAAPHPQAPAPSAAYAPAPQPMHAPVRPVAAPVYGLTSTQIEQLRALYDDLETCELILAQARQQLL